MNKNKKINKNQKLKNWQEKHNKLLFYLFYYIFFYIPYFFYKLNYELINEIVLPNYYKYNLFIFNWQIYNFKSNYG
jgi:membrane-anchored glycerophosphoryl diester phosphodiesterase (GDPDase)